MRLTRTLVPLGLALAVAAAPSALGAGVRTLALPDPAGDANAMNDQGLGLPGLGNGSPGPGSDAAKDILSLTYRSVFKGKTCTGFTAALKLGAAPSASTLYRVRGTAPVNSGLWWLQFDGSTTKLRFADADAGPAESTSIDLSTPATVKGTTITFTVLERDLKASGEKLKGFTVSGPGVDIRSNTGVATAPQWDILVADDASYRPC